MLVLHFICWEIDVLGIPQKLRKCQEVPGKSLKEKVQLEFSVRLAIFNYIFPNILKSVEYSDFPDHDRIPFASKSEDKISLLLWWFQWIVNYTCCPRATDMKEASLSCYVLLSPSLLLLLSQLLSVNACQMTSLDGTESLFLNHWLVSACMFLSLNTK